MNFPGELCSIGIIINANSWICSC